MADVARSVEIAASPDSVFRYVVNEWEGDLDFWEDGIEGWKLLTPPPLKTGARVECILDRWLMEPRWRRAIEASLNNLKGECERRVSG